MSDGRRHRRPRLLARSGFARWRQTRPFWAGVFTILGAILTGWWSLAPIGQTLSTGMGHTSATVLAGVLAVGGVVVWLAPTRRRLIGIVTLTIGLYSVVTAHLGGLLAALAVLVGGAMALSWVAPRILASPLTDAGELSAATETADAPMPEPAHFIEPVIEPEPLVVALLPAVSAVAPVVPDAPVPVVRAPAPPVADPPVRRPSPRRAREPHTAPVIPSGLVPPVPPPLAPTAQPVPVPQTPPTADPFAILPPPVPVEVKWPAEAAASNPVLPQATDS